MKKIDDLNVKTGLLKIENSEFNLVVRFAVTSKKQLRWHFFFVLPGEDFTRMTNELNGQGDIMDAYLLDAICSLTVENAMDKIQEHLKIGMLEQGLKISNRYSPGYCNWPLTDQKSLFGLIGETRQTLNSANRSY